MHVLLQFCDAGPILSFNYLTKKSKKEGKDQELIQSSITPDPGYQWESNKLTIRHHKRVPRGQPFPAGNHKVSISRRERKHNKHKTENMNDPQKKYRLGTVSKNILQEGLMLIL